MDNTINGVNIDKLLDREEVEIKSEEVVDAHRDKNILVTGGAGSIGSELVRQICLYSPESLVIIDQGETPLYHLILELERDFPKLNIDYILGDVSDKKRMKEVFSRYSFDVVYHAAAYKHVPIVEKNPIEGVRVNVLGTKNIADLSFENKVERFIMISTDKTVNPTSMMGVTKKLAESYIQCLQKKEENKTKFITTRFGNVLGSNGSVVYRFKEQIENREPLTITHPDITRYFMTLSESCKLVLQAGAKGKGGEICIFDMGEPMKIVDLAKKMCNFYNIEIGRDIDVIFTGLRDGDKISEELLNSYENIDFVENKIMFSHSQIDTEKIEKVMEDLFLTFYQREESDWKTYLEKILSKI